MRVGHLVKDIEFKKVCSVRSLAAIIFHAQVYEVLLVWFQTSNGLLYIVQCGYWRLLGYLVLAWREC